MRDLLCPAFCALFVLPLAGCDSGSKQIPPANSLPGHVTSADATLHTLTIAEKEHLRDSLTAEGLYDCCTKPGCFECVERLGQCSCYADIRKKDPICGECLEGYRKGDGRLKLVSIPELEGIRNARKRSR